jgi:hypothetical protein
MKNIFSLSIISSLFYLLFLSSCVQAPSPITTAPSAEYGAIIPSDGPEQYNPGIDPGGIAFERPGLATKWGETRTSRVKNTQFNRASHAPTGRATIYYNNRAGIAAMLGISPYQPGLPAWLQVEPYRFIFIAIRGENGQFLENFTANGKRYVIGKTGQRYSIIVRNNTGTRLEVVLSVDGLDVLDGKPASIKKPGYVIAPYATLTVDGFRQNMDTVAAFRFGSVAESYAEQKHGDSTHVGVIGLAVFHERGTQPFSRWINNDVQKRHAADPFPERFATPP